MKPTTIVPVQPGLSLLVESLPNDGTREKYLSALYRPGKKEVFEMLMSISPRTQRYKFEKEIVFAKKREDLAFIEKYGKIYIDHHLADGFLSLLPEKISAWGNETLKEYLVAKLEGIQGSQLEIEYSIKALELFAPNSPQLQKLKDDQLAAALQDTENYFNAARLLVVAKRYNEAIDWYIKTCHLPYPFSFAWKLACEHATGRKTEVAKILFNFGFSAEGDILAYLQAAEFLGNQNIALKNIKQHVTTIQKAKPSPPRFYSDLLEALQLAGMTEEIQIVLLKAKDGAMEKNCLEKYDPGLFIEMAKLYAVVDDTAQVIHWFAKAIKLQTGFAHASDAELSAKKCIELTNDFSIRLALLPVYEKTLQFDKAAQIADEFNSPAEAENYRNLHSYMPKPTTPTEPGAKPSFADVITFNSTYLHTIREGFQDGTFTIDEVRALLKE